MLSLGVGLGTDKTVSFDIRMPLGQRFGVTLSRAATVAEFAQEVLRLNSQIDTKSCYFTQTVSETRTYRDLFLIPDEVDGCKKHPLMKPSKTSDGSYSATFLRVTVLHLNSNSDRNQKVVDLFRDKTGNITLLYHPGAPTQAPKKKDYD